MSSEVEVFSALPAGSQELEVEAVRLMKRIQALMINVGNPSYYPPLKTVNRMTQKVVTR